MKATRIAIVAPEGLSGRGGIGRVMTYLTRYLRVHMPDLVITVHSSRLSGLPVLKHLTVPFALLLFIVRCVVQRVDVVHINVAPRGSTWRKMLYAQVAEMLGKPVILHLHGSGYDAYFKGLSDQRQQTLRAFFGGAARIVVLSDYWKRFMLADLHVPAHKIVEIANGVPAPTIEHKPNAANAVPVIVFIGVVGHRKGIDTLLDALADITRQGLPWSAIIAGDGEVEAAAARAKSLRINQNIQFLGWVSEAEVDTILQSADIFVLPSRAENQPVSILEAMARSVVVVASNVGAIPEQIVDGETGVLVEPGDVEGLATALARLIRAPQLREDFGRAGKIRFQALFSVSACAERFAALYRSVGA